jgi:hypothetical protein
MTLRKKWVNKRQANKKCTRCKKTYPRTEEYFYAKKHHSQKEGLKYNASCIACENKRCEEYKSKNREKQRLSDIKYKETEHGYFKELYNGVRKSEAGNQFKSYEEFFDCWKKQQEFYGLNCPYFPWIQMTRIKGKKRATPTNISKDRILSTMPYGPNNIMFISWKANNMKGDVTPYLAGRYLEFVNKNEYCRKVTEFELSTLDYKFEGRWTKDFNFIADLIEHSRESLELQNQFIEKFLRMIRTEPNQIPEDSEDTSHDN